jgi:hypothetical protein
LVPADCGRYLAENIAGARFVGMPGTDHSIVESGTQDFIADQIEEFVTGERHVHEPDRMLATVMFTDIVGSTQRAAEIGDSQWHGLLSRTRAGEQFTNPEITRFAVTVWRQQTVRAKRGVSEGGAKRISNSGR